MFDEHHQTLNQLSVAIDRTRIYQSGMLEILKLCYGPTEDFTVKNVSNIIQETNKKVLECKEQKP